MRYIVGISNFVKKYYMIRSDKKLKELAAKLEKDNSRQIFQAIKTLREEQPFEGAIGLLTMLYDRTEDNAIRGTILEFMNDLKDQSVAEEIIAEIKKDWKSETINMLISSCWQSGLDYSDYSLVLTELFLRSDYKTALECFSVIEENISRLTEGKKEEMIKIIEEGLRIEENEKKMLIRELLSILS